MSPPARLRRLLRSVLIILPLAFALGGCETFDKLNPFVERKPPLPGERKPLFPEGVPGVDFGAPPPQPANANIPIPSSLGSEESPQPQSTAPAETQAARTAQPSSPRSGTRPKQGDPDDAWAGTR